MIFACSVLLFSSRKVKIVSSLEIVATVGVLVAVPITSRVSFFFVVFDMFGSSFVTLMSYETVKLRFNDDFGWRVVLRSYGVVSLVSIAA